MMTNMNLGAAQSDAGWMTVKSAAEHARISPQSVYNFIKRGDLIGKNRAGKTYVDAEEVRVLAAQKYARHPETATTVPARAAVDRPAKAEQNPLDDTRRWVVNQRAQIDRERAALIDQEAKIAQAREALDARELELMEAEQAITVLDRITAARSGGAG